MLVLVLLMPTSFTVTAKATSNQPVQYIAIGDSIAVGYGLANEQTGFVSQVGQALAGTTNNLAVNGLTSMGLLEALQQENMRDALSEADIISISIGSNDLLGPFSEIMMRVLGSLMSDPSGAANLTVLIEKMNELTLALNSAETVAMFKAQIVQFEKNWAEIITELKDIAPDAKLLVNDLYNPYVDATIIGVPLGIYAEKYIPSMNKILQGNMGKGYQLIPVYQSFQKSGLTNVNVMTLNYDPHPNQQGHDTIANLVKSALSLPITESPVASLTQTKKIKTVLNRKARIFEQKSLRINNRYHVISADEVAQVIGARVNVNTKKQTVTITKSDKSLVVTLNAKQATINGKKVNLSTAVTMNGTHILVPVEAFTKAFGGSYRYDGQTNTLRIQLE